MLILEKEIDQHKRDQSVKIAAASTICKVAFVLILLKIVARLVRSSD